MKSIKVILFLLLPVLVCLSCEETVYKDKNPQLKVIVKNLDESHVSGATVNLYTTVEDFKNGTNVNRTGISDSSGEVLFDELEQIVYFFLAEFDGKSNYNGIASVSYPLEDGILLIVETIIE